MSAGRYEPRDVRAGWALVVLVGAVVAGAALHGQVWYLFQRYRSELQSRDVRRTRVATPSASRGPLLEVSPTSNWEAYRAEQERQLNTYGWISREEGRVRIPI